MKTFILLLFALVFSFLASGQTRIALGGRVGYGTYAMGDIKEFTQEIMQQSSIPLKQVANYPPWFTFRGEFALQDIKGGSTRIWAFYEASSTGARFSLTDNTGKINADFLIQCDQFGIGFENRFFQKNAFFISLFSEGSMLHNRFILKDYLEVGDEIISEKLDLDSKGFALTPGVKIGRRFERFQLSLVTARLLMVSSKPIINNVESAWDGFRVGLQVDIFLDRLK